MKQYKTKEYYLTHQWLLRKFGRATYCENKECSKKSSFYDWALIKGLNYERKKENFIGLCRICHKKYDYTSATGEKITSKLKGHKVSKKTKIKMRLSKLGKRRPPRSQEWKYNLSQALKKHWNLLKLGY